MKELKQANAYSNMERFNAVDAGIVVQKENDPSFAKDENDRITQRENMDSNAKLNLAQQVGGGCCMHNFCGSKSLFSSVRGA